MSRRESPVKRRNPKGGVVWVARYTGGDGKRRVAKPSWNGGSGTLGRRSEAQRAIDEAYSIPDRAETLGAYSGTWLQKYPRSHRTNQTNAGRLRAVLQVQIEGRALGDWPLHELRRRHALALIDAMLRDQGRAPSGAANVVRVLSAMQEDAITDELAENNPFKGVRVRANDLRARKGTRPVRVFSFDELHRLAAAGGMWEAMLRTFTDTGMRLGEILALGCRDFDGRTFRIRGTAFAGTVTASTGEKNHDRSVPCPPGLAALLAATPHHINSDFLFPTKTGRLWWARNFYRDVWWPAQKASGIDARPHECRHSWITHMRAAGINDADLAQVAGHTVDTMLARYTHPQGRSMEAIRSVVG